MCSDRVHQTPMIRLLGRRTLTSTAICGLSLVLTQCVSSYEVLSHGGASGAGSSSGGDASGDAGRGAGSPSCVLDDDCPPRAWCVDGNCIDCPLVPSPCGALISRNGCEWCVPAWDCNTEIECNPGEQCYSGQTCSPGCNGDSTCCYGNICSIPGCSTTEGLDCAVVGCAPGFYCDIVVPDPACACVQGSWVCSPASGNTCRAN